MAKLDKDVRKLLEKLEQEKQELESLKTLSAGDWKTSGKLLISGFEQNIREGYQDTLIKVSRFVLAENKDFSKIEILFELTKEEVEKYSLIQGYKLEDWLDDLKKRWHYIEYRRQLKDLQEKEKKAKALLSEDEIKKMQLEELTK